MYIIAFGVAYLLYKRQIQERNFPMSADDLSGLFVWGIVGLLVGARVFATIVYETSDIYRREPWLVFWPFRNGRFTGLQGMSYHGGVIGGIIGFVIYSAMKRFDVREIADMFAASIPLGYTFGRLGNFINQELYGRITASPIGMVFPDAKTYPASLPWVQETAEKVGFPIPSADAMLNLPRHPSQLYEALIEGVVLWAVIWLIRNKKPFKGFTAGIYILGYGLFRFFIEYFREPDADLGYRFEIVKTELPIALYHPFLSFSTGQIFCFAMIVLGLVWLIVAAVLPNRKPIRVYEKEPRAGNEGRKLTPQDREEDRKIRRKMRRRSGKR
jgi:phosphatidylglycerol:prolipoprotein diacylglycerol transferase